MSATVPKLSPRVSGARCGRIGDAAVCGAFHERTDHQVEREFARRSTELMTPWSLWWVWERLTASRRHAAYNRRLAEWHNESLLKPASCESVVAERSLGHRPFQPQTTRTAQVSIPIRSASFAYSIRSRSTGWTSFGTWSGVAMAEIEAHYHTECNHQGLDIARCVVDSRCLTTGVPTLECDSSRV